MKCLLCSLLLLCNCVLAQTELKVGDKAPDIFFQQSFPSNYNLPSNKPMILDFWGTYCAPCIAELSESNYLVTKYSKQIEFVAITDSNSWNVGKFIKARNFKYNFIIDDSNITFNNYAINDVPDIFLIDSNKTIEWIGTSLDEKIIQQFIKTGFVTHNDTLPVFSKQRFEGDIPKDTYKLVIVDNALLEKSKTVLSVLLENNETLGSFHNKPEANGCFTGINYDLLRLTDITQNYFENKKLKCDNKSLKRYDFINVPFKDFKRMNKYLLKNYGIHFVKVLK